MTQQFPWFVEVALGALAVCLALGIGRLLRGPTLPDRVVALDYMAVVGVAALAILGHAYDDFAYLDVAGALALIAFVSSVAFARYLERKALR